MTKAITAGTEVVLKAVKPKIPNFNSTRQIRSEVFDSVTTSSKKTDSSKNRIKNWFKNLFSPKEIKKVEYFPGSKVKSSEIITNREGIVIRNVKYSENGSILREEIFDPKTNRRLVNGINEKGERYYLDGYGDTVYSEIHHDKFKNKIYEEKFNPVTKTRSKKYLQGRNIQREINIDASGASHEINYANNRNEIFRDVNGKITKTITHSKIKGENRLIGGYRDFNKTVIEDFSTGTKKIITEKHTKDGLDIIQCEQVLKNGNEISYLETTFYGKWKNYERIYNPKTGVTEEKFFFEKDVLQDRLNTPSVIRKKKNGKIIYEAKYNRDGKKIYEKAEQEPISKPDSKIKNKLLERHLTIEERNKVLNDIEHKLDKKMRLNNDDWQILGKTLEVSNVELLKNISNKTNVEAQKLCRELYQKFHPDKGNTGDSIAFRVINKLANL